MQPQDPNQYSPNPPAPSMDPHQRVDNALTVTQPGETTIFEIKRHPVGIIATYVVSAFILIVLAVLAFGVAPRLSSDGSNAPVAIAAAVFLIVAVIVAIYTLIASKVYWGNSWILTSDSLTQVNQVSLFKRLSSQLSLGNLEDVTAEQDGILCHMFNYGLIRVETAGERGKFVFFYCPNPNFYAKQVLEAREAFEQERRGDDQQRPYRAEGAYAQSYQATGAPFTQPPAGPGTQMPPVPQSPPSAPPYGPGDQGFNNPGPQGPQQ